MTYKRTSLPPPTMESFNEWYLRSNNNNVHQLNQLNIPTKASIFSLQTNLLANGNFDTSTTTGCPTGLTSCPTNWTSGQSTTGAASFYYTSGRGGTGHAVGMYFASYVSGQYAYWYQTIGATAGTSYILSGYIENFSIVQNTTNTSSGAYISVEWLNSAGTSISGNTAGQVAVGTISTYTLHTQTFTAPTGTAWAMIECMLNDCSGQAFFDDLYFGSGCNTTPIPNLNAT